MSDLNYDFFISFSFEDHKVARWIKEVLEENGKSICVCDGAAGNFVGCIEKCVDRSEAMIVILSKKYIDAGKWTKLEREIWTTYNMHRNKKLNIFPVMVEKCTLPPLLSPYSHFELGGINFKNKKTGLLAFLENRNNASTSLSGTIPREPMLFDWPSNSTDDKFFVERPLPEKSLKECFQERDVYSRPVVCVIVGMGGIGKTKIAARYGTKQYLVHYSLICWIDAEEPTVLQKRFIDLGKRLEVDVKREEGQSNDDWIKAVNSKLCTQLNERGDWLIVFDNATDYETVKRYIPIEGPGHVLITTRLQSGWEPFVAGVHELGVMKPKQSIDLLSRGLEMQEDKKYLGMIADRLGHLPLALVHARGWMKKLKKGSRDYLDRIKEDGELVRLMNKKNLTPDDYKTIVGKTWETSREAAVSQCPAAGVLLDLLAVFAPGPIARKLMDLVEDAEKRDLLPEELRDRDDLEDAVMALRDVSLLELLRVSDNEQDPSAGSEYYELHRLVRETTGSVLRETHRLNRFRFHYCRLMLGRLPSGTFKDPTKLESKWLDEQLEEIWTAIQDLLWGQYAEPTIECLKRLLRYLVMNPKPQEKEKQIVRLLMEAHERADQLCRDAGGDPEPKQRLRRIASIFPEFAGHLELEQKSQNAYERACEFYKKGIEYNQKSVAPPWKLWGEAACRDGLSEALREMGKETDARNELEEASRLFEQVGEVPEIASHPTFVAIRATHQLNRANGLIKKVAGTAGEERVRAIDRVLKALDVAQRFYESLDSKDEQWRNRINRRRGDMYRLLEDSQRALPCYEKALEIGEACSDGQGVARSSLGMALVEKSLGHTELAMEYFSSAKTTFENFGDVFSGDIKYCEEQIEALRGGTPLAGSDSERAVELGVTIPM